MTEPERLPAHLERTSSLPQLESVPSPPRVLQTQLGASPSSSAASTSTPFTAAAVPSSAAEPASVPELHDELPRSFSGSLLQSLSHLGVAAYRTADVEQTVIARALQVEAEAQHARQAAAAAHPRRQPPSSSLKRKIPRKADASIASSRSPLPVLAPLVHHDDPVSAAGTMAKKRLEDALAIRSRRNKPNALFPAPTPTIAGGRAVDDGLPSGVTERQRLIDGGEVTPFHAMPGVERHYRRVSRPAQIPTAEVQPPRSAAPQRKEPERARQPKPSAASPHSLVKPGGRRAVTPTLHPPPPAASSRARLSATPPPQKVRPSSSSDARSAPARPPSPPSSAIDLPARLTRARVKEEARSLELAMRKSEMEHKGVKEEIVVDDDADGEDVAKHEGDGAVRMMEEDDGTDDAAKEEADDGEWKGDDESSEDEQLIAEDDDASDEEHKPARRPVRRGRPMQARRRLMKAVDVEDEETERAEAEEVVVEADDDDDDDDVEDVPSPTSRRGHGRLQDDFLDEVYEERLSAIRHSRIFANEVRRVEGRDEAKEGEREEDSLDVAFDGGYVLPGRIWDRLFGYQRTSIKWMWELHSQNAGGIVADEMGLGKTIQMVAFLAGLHYSQAIFRASAASSSSSSPSLTQSPFLLPPSLILCPATIMTQWLREFHTWYPEMRVLVLHDSVQAQHGQSKEAVVDQLFSSAHVLITTYECARIHRDLLLHREWGYVVLDEGHKIRNPDAAITLTCKQLLSVHRLVLTGAPIQNDLTELWSLFDFVFPGKLGTLPVFEDEFCFPINQGGYTNASATQVQLAYRCASVLRELINPYVLRRNKADVAQHLPTKTEQVLFVNLAPAQRALYKEFLASDTVQETIDGRGSLFKAIHILRKLCNHPHLLSLKDAWGPMTSAASSRRKVQPRDIPDFGAAEYSGKMQVVEQVLAVWHAEGHRVLLFAQTRQMLDILEQFVAARYTYHRIDGLTSIRSRLPLIDSFNSDASVFTFLLTTKAGGLGVNLTGADRVLLYDPDWNPSTDLQARERSWRIGQRREVTVYRLIVRGTIEEKIYHRQIFKQFLTQKILADPKQRRFFTRRDMKDLFSLDEAKGGESETARVFRDVAHEVYTADPDPEQKEPSHTPPSEDTAATADEVPGTARRKRLKKGTEDEQTEPAPTFDVEPYKEEDGSSTSTAAAGATTSSATANNRILSLLFSKGGITSAMSHDSIMEGSSRAEKSIAETVAKKVAERAVEALRKSREEMRGQPLSVPTWTGRNGYQGAAAGHGERRRFGTVVRAGLETKSRESREGERTRVYDEESAGGSRLFDHSVSGFTRPSDGSSVSSSALLARLKQRGEQGLVAVSSGLAAAQSMTSIEERDARQSFNAPLLTGLLDDLQSHLAAHREGVTTQQLIDAFSSRLTTDQDKFTFRQLLRHIAVLDKGPRGGGRWKLKPSSI